MTRGAWLPHLALAAACLAVVQWSADDWNVGLLVVLTPVVAAVLRRVP